MKGLVNSWLFFIAIMIVGSTSAQQSIAWSTLDSNSIMIGDQVVFELGITAPKNSVVSWPVINDTLTSNIEVLRRKNIDTTLNNSEISYNQKLIITSFDSGYFEIPPIEFKLGYPGDSTTSIFSTGVLFLQVFVPEVDTTQAFKPIIGPIKEPYTLMEVLPWIVVITAGIVLIILLIIYLRRKKKKQPVFKRKPKPELPAHVLAINQLEELRLAKIWQSGKLKKYYTKLTDIIREYIANRYGYDALERTSFEITTELNNYNINKEAMNKLESVLNLSDMVKFAKSVPTALENDLGLTHCVDFVNETKKAEISEVQATDKDEKLKEVQ
jgi:hypothetical protein